MFSGISSLAIDVKGRMAIPTKHRDALAAKSEGWVTLTADTDGCLLLYAKSDWEIVADRIMAMSNQVPRVRLLQELIVGHADHIELDTAGRILISPELRAYGKLEAKGVLMGQGNKFYLWDESKYHARVALAQASAQAPVPSELAGFST
jgi:MraZ protein